MTDTPYSRGPRNDGAEVHTSLGTLFRGWLRAAMGSKADTNWRDTIEELIEEGEDGEDAAIAEHERKLIGNVLRLRELTAVDVMVPRADIVAVDAETALSDLRDILSTRAHSRLPVYRGEPG